MTMKALMQDHGTFNIAARLTPRASMRPTLRLRSCEQAEAPNRWLFIGPLEALLNQARITSASMNQAEVRIANWCDLMTTKQRRHSQSRSWMILTSKAIARSICTLRIRLVVLCKA